LVHGNVIFDTVLESLDHGPVNVWDRQQWIEPANKLLQPILKFTGNLVIGNANGYKGIDLDDGARRISVTNNIVLDGLIKLKGSDIVHSDNYLVPIDGACILVTPLNNAANTNNLILTRNTCVSPTLLPPYFFNVRDPEATRFCQVGNLKSSENSYAGTKGAWNGCGRSSDMTLNVWQQQYKQDLGTAATVVPPLPGMNSMLQTIAKLVEGL